MQPENTPPKVTDPNHPYEFILGDGQKAQQPKQHRSIMPNLPKPLMIGIGIVLALFVVIAVFVVISSGNTGNAQKYLAAMGRAQEITRVTSLSTLRFQNADTVNLAATTKAALSSEQNQLVAYLQSVKVKVDPKKLTTYLNSQTDAQLATAAQNNSLDETYITYLKTQLTAYQASLKTAAQTAPKKAQPILAGAIASTENLLRDPQFLASN